MRNRRPLMVTVTRDRSFLRDEFCCSALMIAQRSWCLAPISSASLGIQHGTDRADRGIKSARDLPVGALERARARHRGVEVARQARPVVVKRMNLRHQIVLAEVNLVPF